MTSRPLDARTANGTAGLSQSERDGREARLLEDIAMLLDGAERARIDGSDVAMIALLSAAAQRIELHRLLYQ